MADRTSIEWADATWNPVTGCSVVSPGCTNCYAMQLAGTRLRHHPSRAGLTQDSKAGPVWNGEVRFNEQWLDQPLRWKAPRRIFVSAHGDLFHESVPDEWIDRVWSIMARAHWHTFQVLTKRPARMRAYLARFKPCELASGFITRDGEEPTSYGGTVREPIFGAPRWPAPHVWLGVSVEDQARADERIPELLATPAAVRFISAEPLLGPIDLCNLTIPRRYGSGLLDAFTLDFKTHHQEVIAGPPKGHGPLDLVIAGGESGHKARPMHPEWARALRDQCQAAGVSFFFKQWGAFEPSKYGARTIAAAGNIGSAPMEAWPDGSIGAGHEDTNGGKGTTLFRVGQKTAGRLLDGREWSELPS